MTEAQFETVEKMEKYGGSFVKALAECFYRADPNNFLKLRIAFPEYWEEYESMRKDGTKIFKTSGPGGPLQDEQGKGTSMVG